MMGISYTYTIDQTRHDTHKHSLHAMQWVAAQHTTFQYNAIRGRVRPRLVKALSVHIIISIINPDTQCRPTYLTYNTDQT